MKKLMSVVLAAVVAVPAAAFAQSAPGHVTRAEVRAELAQLEAVGYSPSTHDVDYPQAMQAAEAKVAMREAQRAAYGGVPSTTQKSSAPHAEERSQ